MSELKPCPFCGSEEIYLRDDDGGWFYHQCQDCGAESGRSIVPSMSSDAWNTRADGWVSVKERLPEGCKEVLVHDGTRPIVMRFAAATEYHYARLVPWCEDEEAYDNNNAVSVHCFTHWKPISRL